MSVTRVGKVSPPEGSRWGGLGQRWVLEVPESPLLTCFSVSAWHRLYSHIQLASKLTSGCDYSLFKV